MGCSDRVSVFFFVFGWSVDLFFEYVALLERHHELGRNELALFSGGINGDALELFLDFEGTKSLHGEGRFIVHAVCQLADEGCSHLLHILGSEVELAGYLIDEILVVHLKFSINSMCVV